MSSVYALLQDLAWYFGDHEFNGECCEGLSFTEFMALKKARESTDLSIQDMAAALNFTKSGATRVVNRLESKGYMRRQRSLADGRVCCVSVTEEGKEVLHRITQAYVRYLEALLQPLEPHAVGEIKSALQVLVSLVRKHRFS